MRLPFDGSFGSKVGMRATAFSLSVLGAVRRGVVGGTFFVTASGRVKHKQAHKSHLLTHERTKRKRRLRGSKVVNQAQEKQVKSLLPYQQ